ncbi:hypothetical protein HA402_013850 [Bradysia odoriphaga]|nr:hypothetical protein HA402_013850 [Bradysia odoriphaga]
MSDDGMDPMDVDDNGDSDQNNENCGHKMEDIYRLSSEWDLRHFPGVKPSPNHTVLYQTPIINVTVPPIPHKGPGRWDANHVRLPCAQQNQYVVRNEDDTEEVKERWSLIRTALSQDIRTSHDLEAAILSYNTKYSKTWRFNGLHKLFQDSDEKACESFFTELLPKIIRLALALPELIPSAIPLLKRGTTKSVSFSQEQITSLLANAFLCTFPRRNAQGKRSEYRSFPDINFNRLFESSEHNVVEKLKCICHYFRRVTNNMPTGVVTFTRRCMPEKHRIRWDKWEGDFRATKLHVTAYGTIEDDGRGLLQVDFANKFLGGGVLGFGCVQEEIRFVICPEMIVSKLITEVLDKNEALLMIGCERFSSYSGYASTFEWNGNFTDRTPYDESRRRLCNVVAIDALNFYAASDQYREELIRRELDKAYVGYYHELKSPAPGVATGNWGCGAFGGNKRLKALIQLMVCCVTCRPMVYFTFFDKELRDELLEMRKFLVDEGITVAELWSSLVQIRNHKIAPEHIYSFIYQWHRDIKYAHLMLNDSPNFDSTDVPPAESAIPSSSTRFQWPSKKNRQSIPSSTFYSKSNCDTTTKQETSSDKSPIGSDLYRKSKSSLLDPADREHYHKELTKMNSKQTVTGGSSLLDALDEDYGAGRTSNEQTDLPSSKSDRLDAADRCGTGGSSFLNALDEDYDDCNIGQTADDQANLPSSQPIDQPNGNVDMFASTDGGDSEQKMDSQEKSASNEESNDDSEDVIPCTPPPEKCLKRKAISNKKQIKITDIYTKLNVN